MRTMKTNKVAKCGAKVNTPNTAAYLKVAHPHKAWEYPTSLLLQGNGSMLVPYLPALVVQVLAHIFYSNIC